MASFSSHRNSLLRKGIRLLPPFLRLRALTWLDVWQDSTEPENVWVPRRMPKDRRAVALDVGANNGVTTQLLAREFQRVHAFEPNPQLAADLTACVPKNVQVHAVAGSSQNGAAELVIPVSKGVVQSSWGSLCGTFSSEFEQFQKFSVETRTIDSFLFDHVDYLKIDVEGHEMSVLDGAKETIGRCRPWLVVEAMGEQQTVVRAFLKSFGYHETNLATLAGVTGREHNLIFLP